MSLGFDIAAEGSALFTLVLESLDAVGSVHTLIPGELALTGHCLYCATVAPEWNGNYLLHYWVSVVKDQSIALLPVIAARTRPCCFVLLAVATMRGLIGQCHRW